ncbi:MAG: hypothetical protein P9L99_13900 [Candidatus Lernaella stagnicola]|nr:hypothetical protein [Candidatus Lernaella stagnicola]
MTDKWIVHAVVFNQEHFLRPWVRNAVRYADAVVVMFSDKPWGYNPRARDLFPPDATGEMLTRLEKEYDTLHVVRGEWDNETDERNEAVELARKLGGRYLLVVDTDEFFRAADIQRAKQWLRDHPAPTYHMPHIQLIKKAHWAIETSEGLPRFQFAIDLQHDVRFADKRNFTTPEGHDVPRELCCCYHFSYLLPEDKLREKLGSFGHSQEIRPDWLEKVWPAIGPGSRNFHPVWPEAWKRLFEIELPGEIVADFADEEAWRELLSEPSPPPSPWWRFRRR